MCCTLNGLYYPSTEHQGVIRILSAPAVNTEQPGVVRYRARRRPCHVYTAVNSKHPPPTLCKSIKLSSFQNNLKQARRFCCLLLQSQSLNVQNYITLELGTKGKEIFFGWTKDFYSRNIGNIEVSVLGSSYDFKQRGETPAHTVQQGFFCPC